MAVTEVVSEIYFLEGSVVSAGGFRIEFVSIEEARKAYDQRAVLTARASGKGSLIEFWRQADTKPTVVGFSVTRDESVAAWNRHRGG